MILPMDFTINNNDPFYGNYLKGKQKDEKKHGLGCSLHSDVLQNEMCNILYMAVTVQNSGKQSTEVRVSINSTTA